MQRTRINLLIDLANQRLQALFTNPWRNLALSLISLLLGIFIGTAVITTAGQAAYYDVPAAGFLLLFSEIVSRLVYGGRRRSLLFRVVNIFKMGLTYSLFLEAFKLGS